MSWNWTRIFWTAKQLVELVRMDMEFGK